MKILEARGFFLIALLLSVLAICPFVPGLGGSFILDDKPNIVKNASLHISALSFDGLASAAYSFQPGKGSRSLAMLSFSLDYLMGGLDPGAFKRTNLLVHMLTTLALVMFLLRLFLLLGMQDRNAKVGALLLAAVWAIHPLNVSSVLYVVQRMQTLVTLFMVLAMWAYLMMREAQIDGRRSRGYGVLMVLFWVLGLASKEDAVLLPAYTLAIELTVLRFKAAEPALAKLWSRFYLVLVLVGLAAFFLMVVPRYWHWDFYPAREFSSLERLLTQGRVMLMYLLQCLVPYPGFMPFYYDDLEVSRSLFQPLSTLPSLLVVGGLVLWAWHWRLRHPLFSLGMFLFFAGHLITSNVVNLELAFEHRNHLPLIGLVIAVADLFAIICKRWLVSFRLVLWIVPALIVASLCAATLARSYAWGDVTRFAQSSVALAPYSERAWLVLCGTYFEQSRGEASSPYLGKAIDSCEAGARVTNSAPMLSNIVIFKTVRGDATHKDWERLLARLREVRMNSQNKGIAMITLDNLDRGIPLDEAGVLQTLEIISSRAEFEPREYLRMGAYIHNQSHAPEKALPYMVKAIERYPPLDPAALKLIDQLKSAGRAQWASELEVIRRTKLVPGGGQAH